MPYIIQQIRPVINRINIINETSSADFVFHVLYNWGKNDMVVSKAAKKPNKSI